MDEHAPSLVELPSHPELARLAREDPAAYERWRSDVIEAFIAGAPTEMQARLRGLQFRIDGVRRLAKSPLGSALRVYSMMWDSFTQLNEQMCSFDCPRPMTPMRPAARVVEFRRRAAPRQHD